MGRRCHRAIWWWKLISCEEYSQQAMHQNEIKWRGKESCKAMVTEENSWQKYCYLLWFTLEIENWFLQPLIGRLLFHFYFWFGSKCLDSIEMQLVQKTVYVETLPWSNRTPVQIQMAVIVVIILSLIYSSFS